MPEPHLFQNIAVLAFAWWWTSKWLVTRPATRWRFAAAGLVSVPAWVLAAFLSLGSVSASSGVQILYASPALAWFCGFMAFASVVGTIIGIALWTEEEVERTGDRMPESVRSGLGD